MSHRQERILQTIQKNMAILESLLELSMEILTNNNDCKVVHSMHNAIAHMLLSYTKLSTVTDEQKDMQTNWFIETAELLIKK